MNRETGTCTFCGIAASEPSLISGEAPLAVKICLQCARHALSIAPTRLRRGPLGPQVPRPRTFLRLENSLNSARCSFCGASRVSIGLLYAAASREDARICNDCAANAAMLLGLQGTVGAPSRVAQPIFESPYSSRPGQSLFASDRIGALFSLTTLTESLVVGVTHENYDIWQLCAHCSDSRWADMQREGDGFRSSLDCALACFWGMLIPPQVAIDSIVRHYLLAPLGFSLLDRMLARGLVEFLDSTGRVQRAFSVQTEEGARIYSPNSELARCDDLTDRLVLQGLAFSSRDSGVARAYRELSSACGKLLSAPANDAWRCLNSVRREFPEPSREIPNFVPMIANIVSFLYIAQMSTEEYPRFVNAAVCARVR